MLGNLLGGFIVVLVGVNLIGTLADEVQSATIEQTNTSKVTNVTGISSTVLSLTIIFFALGVMSAGVSLAVQGLKNAGVL